MDTLDFESAQADPNALVAEDLRLRLASQNGDLGPGPHDGASLKAFVCECGCHAPISMSLGSYERIRREGGGVVVPGHQAEEPVLRREAAYWVVRRAA